MRAVSSSSSYRVARRRRRGLSCSWGRPSERERWGDGGLPNGKKQQARTRMRKHGGAVVTKHSPHCATYLVDGLGQGCGGHNTRADRSKMSQPQEGVSPQARTHTPTKRARNARARTTHPRYSARAHCGTNTQHTTLPGWRVRRTPQRGASLAHAHTQLTVDDLLQHRGS